MHHADMSHSLKGITQKARAVLLVAILVMWISTVAYWIATLLAAVKLQSILHDTMSQIMRGLSYMYRCFDRSATRTSLTTCPEPTWLNTLDFMEKFDFDITALDGQQCVGTIALTINVSISSVTCKRVLSTHIMLGHRQRCNRLVARMGHLEQAPYHPLHRGYDGTAHC